MDILPLLDLGRSMRSRKICSSNVPHTTPFILLLFLWHLHTHYQNLKAFLGFCSQLWLIYHEVLVSCFPQTSVHPSTIQLPKFCCSLLTSILIISLFAVLRGYPICTALCHVSTEGVELHVCVSSPCTGEYQWRAILRTWWDALLFRKCWHGGDGLGRKAGTLRLEAHSF